VLQVTSASLTSKAKNGERSFVEIETEGESYTVAVLVGGLVDCVPLNLLFPPEQEIKFKCSGALVHLTGIVQEDPSSFEGEGFGSDEEGGFDESGSEGGSEESGSGSEDEAPQHHHANAKHAGPKITEIHEGKPKANNKAEKPHKATAHEHHDGEKGKAAKRPAAEQHAEAPKKAKTEQHAEAPKKAKAEKSEEAPKKPKADTQFKCTQCSKSFGSEKGLESHKKSTSH